MSETNPVQLLVAAFQSENGAKEAWNVLKVAKWGGIININRMAIIRRSEKDKVKIRESGDPGGGRGAVFGTIVGSVIGAIAGPIGAVVVGGATGAVVGGLAAKFHDHGIPNHRLERIGESLQPGTSAIVAVIEHKWVGELEKALQEQGANIATEALSDEIAKQLSEGKEMAFSAVSTDGKTTVSELTGNDSGIQSTTITLGDDVVAIEKLEADENGIAVFDLVSNGKTVLVTETDYQPIQEDVAEEESDSTKGE